MPARTKRSAVAGSTRGEGVVGAKARSAPKSLPEPKARTKPTARPEPNPRPKAKARPTPKARPKPKRPSLQNGSPEAADVIYRQLVVLYPDAHCELDFGSPYQLLAATILSAQCTDKRVNMTTPALFAAYPGPRELAAARREDVEAIIKSTGFFRAKAKSLIGMAGALVDRHGASVPSQMDALVLLPGVGRKTANVVLGNAFDINVGVVVDTHVGRVAVRLGLTGETDPVKVEQALMRLVPSERWTMLSHLLIWHGRRICDARKPRCGDCPLAPLCPSAQLPA